MTNSLPKLSKQIRACRQCIENPVGAPLPHEPRPVMQVSTHARMAICGQAPGTRVHKSGKPFTDPSGERLRDWMGISEEAFYDRDLLAIIPMGFCFPGLNEKGGDLPPRKECARLWHDELFRLMPQLDLIILVGIYAQKYHLGRARKASLTETVKNWREYIDGPDDIKEDARSGRKYIALPHPSWRNNSWIKKNQWFSDEVLPRLKTEVHARLPAS